MARLAHLARLALPALLWLLVLTRAGAEAAPRARLARLKIEVQHWGGPTAIRAFVQPIVESTLEVAAGDSLRDPTSGLEAGARYFVIERIVSADSVEVRAPEGRYRSRALTRELVDHASVGALPLRLVSNTVCGGSYLTLSIVR
jgi:hypothetical protein